MKIMNLIQTDIKHYSNSVEQSVVDEDSLPSFVSRLKKRVVSNISKP